MVKWHALSKSPCIERSKTIDLSVRSPVFSSWFSNRGFSWHFNFGEFGDIRVDAHWHLCFWFFLSTYYRVSNSWQRHLAWVLSSSFYAGPAGTGNFLVRAAILGEIIPLCLSQAQFRVNRDSRLLIKSIKNLLQVLNILNIKLPKCQGSLNRPLLVCSGD